ncbi:hypothetical protein NBRC111894_4130 [Sporolactobacillus inulinus]|uniref:Uncharacterized protein n=1 Tax=Sporolactobacillus inulinus TaxID=2078 RepID=A0A4Y1ZH91_9BACL|nr:hypothetical protein NBRC111894_4130 [Sporolactobacillus inulinus]
MKEDKCRFKMGCNEMKISTKGRYGLTIMMALAKTKVADRFR